MAILGLILLILGIILGIHLLFVLGAVILVVGLILLALSMTGTAFGGHRYY